MDMPFRNLFNTPKPDKLPSPARENLNRKFRIVFDSRNTPIFEEVD